MVMASTCASPPIKKGHPKEKWLSERVPRKVPGKVPGKGSQKGLGTARDLHEKVPGKVSGKGNQTFLINKIIDR